MAQIQKPSEHLLAAKKRPFFCLLSYFRKQPTTNIHLGPVFLHRLPGQSITIPGDGKDQTGFFDFITQAVDGDIYRPVWRLTINRDDRINQLIK